MAALLGCDIDDDDVVEASQRQRQVGLVALSHMLADAWRVHVNGPRLQAKQIEALAKLMPGSQLR